MLEEKGYERRAALLTLVFCVPLFLVILFSAPIMDYFLDIFFPRYGDYYPPPPDQLMEALTLIGYLSLFIISFIIVVGVFARKGKLTLLGSTSFFLPTYGYFAVTMWGLQFAGVAVARVPYLPIVAISPSILRLGEVVYLPTLFNRVISFFWSISSMILGFAFLSVGTYDWILGKLRRRTFVDFGIYKYVRHPQYLAYLLVSYSLLLSASFGTEYEDGFQGWPPPSLPWVVSALLVIGVALHEDNVMRRKLGKEYVTYRNRTYFMFSLPRRLSRVLLYPCRLLFRRDSPETGFQIATLLLFYGLVVIILSVPIMLFWHWP